jgi:hypothetical protein
VSAKRAAKSQTTARRGHYSFGTITAISGNTVTIKPETPDFVAARQAASGKTPKPLPASITFNVNADTAYERHGAAAVLGDYKAGDEIAVVLTGKVRSGQGVALKLLDVDTVRQGYGKGRGPFGLRPVYGTVVSVDKGSITVKPETPDFVIQRREQRRAAKAAAAGLPAPAPAKPRKPQDKPNQTATLNALTQYWQNSAVTPSDPFRAGDQVAIYPAPGSTAASLTAASVRDYATVQSGAARKATHRARKAGSKPRKAHRAKRAARPANG